MDNSERIERMHALLNDAFQPSTLEIVDDSHKHAGHEGAKGGGGHFNVTIYSAAFEGKTPIQRHRMVYDALGDMMKSDIHALSIVAKVPEQDS